MGDIAGVDGACGTDEVLIWLVEEDGVISLL